LYRSSSGAASKPLHEKIVLATLRGGCESGGVKPELD
jgi:hypothetical protein